MLLLLPLCRRRYRDYRHEHHRHFHSEYHHHPEPNVSFLCSLQEEVCLRNLNVRVEKRGELTVSFCGSKERDEDNMLCEMDVTLPPSTNNPDVSAVKMFPFSCC